MVGTPSSMSTTSRAYALGLGSAALIMTFFALAWWGIASQGVSDRWALPYWLAVYAISLAILAVALLYFRAARKLPRDRSPESVAQGKAMGRQLGIRFGIIFGLEFIIAAAASIILQVINHPEYFFPVLAIIVGAHFLPLASIFQVRAYYVTGICLCLVGGIVLLATPSTATLGSARVWDVLPGLLCGPILWLTAIVILVRGRSVLLQASRAQPS